MFAGFARQVGLWLVFFWNRWGYGRHTINRFDTTNTGSPEWVQGKICLKTMAFLGELLNASSLRPGLLLR